MTHLVEFIYLMLFVVNNMCQEDTLFNFIITINLMPRIISLQKNRFLKRCQIILLVLLSAIIILNSHYQLNTICKFQIMGCYSSHQKRSDKVLQSSKFRGVGSLTVSIQNYKLDNGLMLFEKYNLLKLSISNQIHEKLFRKGQKIDNKFQYIINSSNKLYGRMLLATLQQQHETDQKKIAYGIIDLDPYLIQKSAIVRCFIDTNRMAAGYINFKIQFKELQYQLLSFKINSAFIRNHQNRQRRYLIRLTIGEEVLETQPKKQCPDTIPSWKTQIKTVKVPYNLKKGNLTVIQKLDPTMVILGQLQLNFHKLIDTPYRIINNENLYLENNMVGTICFDTVAGHNYQIQLAEPYSPLRKGRLSQFPSINKSFHNSNLSTDFSFQQIKRKSKEDNSLGNLANIVKSLSTDKSLSPQSPVVNKRKYEGKRLKLVSIKLIEIQQNIQQQQASHRNSMMKNPTIDMFPTFRKAPSKLSPQNKKKQSALQILSKKKNLIELRPKKSVQLNLNTSNLIKRGNKENYQKGKRQQKTQKTVKQFVLRRKFINVENYEFKYFEQNNFYFEQNCFQVLDLERLDSN